MTSQVNIKELAKIYHDEIYNKITLTKVSEESKAFASAELREAHKEVASALGNGSKLEDVEATLSKIAPDKLEEIQKDLQELRNALKDRDKNLVDYYQAFPEARPTNTESNPKPTPKPTSNQETSANALNREEKTGTNRNPTSTTDTDTTTTPQRERQDSISATHRNGGTLRLGDQGNAVLDLKRIYRSATGAQIEINGVYDEGFKRLIEKFQKDHGLEADGVTGKSTIAALVRELAREGRNAPSAKDIEAAANEVFALNITGKDRYLQELRTLSGTLASPVATQQERRVRSEVNGDNMYQNLKLDPAIARAYDLLKIIDYGDKGNITVNMDHSSANRLSLRLRIGSGGANAGNEIQALAKQHEEELKKLGVTVRHDWLEGAWLSNIVIEKTTPTTTIFQAKNAHATIDDVLGGKVKVGMGHVIEGASVKELRLLLKGTNELDLYNYMGRSPERFDADLEKAVKSFQSRVGLNPTGVVDKETLNKLIDDFVSKVDHNSKNASWITQFHKAHADLLGSPEMKDIDAYVARMRGLSAAS